MVREQDGECITQNSTRPIDGSKTASQPQGQVKHTLVKHGPSLWCAPTCATTLAMDTKGGPSPHTLLAYISSLQQQQQAQTSQRLPGPLVSEYQAMAKQQVQTDTGAWVIGLLAKALPVHILGHGRLKICRFNGRSTRSFRLVHTHLMQWQRLMRHQASRSLI